VIAADERGGKCQRVVVRELRRQKLGEGEGAQQQQKTRELCRGEEGQTKGLRSEWSVLCV